MEGFSVATERIATAGTGVTDVGTALAREIAAMHGMLDEIRAGWRSTDAAPRFAAVMTSHLDQASTLKDALLSHGESLVAVGRRFDETEAAVAGAIPVVAS